MKFLNLETGYSFDALWNSTQEKGYIFWFKNEQSIGLTYTMPIAFITETSEPIELSIEKNSIFSFISNNSSENTNIDGYVFNAPIYSNIFITTPEQISDTKYVHVFNVACKSDNAGEYICKINIGNKGYIRLGADFYGEHEPIYINLANFGVELPTTIQKAIYDTNVHEDITDNILMNRKLKELMSNYWDIIANKGSYKSLLNSLEWFEWNDQLKIREIYKHNEANRIIFNDKEMLDTLNDSIESSMSNFAKTTYISLYCSLQNELPSYDNEYNPNLTPVVFKWTKNDIQLKLALLAKFFGAYFLPIHLSILHATVEDTVFTNTLKNIHAGTVKRDDLFGDFSYVNCNIKDNDKFYLSNVRAQVTADTLFGILSDNIKYHVATGNIKIYNKPYNVVNNNKVIVNGLNCIFENGKVTVNGIKYDTTVIDGIVTINNAEYKVIDNKVTINDIEYEVKNGYISINRAEYNAILKTGYILVDGDKYTVADNKVTVNNTEYEAIGNKVIINGVIYYITKTLVTINNTDYEVINDKVTINDIDYDITNGTVVINSNNYKVNCNIITINDIIYPVKDNIITINGNRYDVIDNKVIIDGVNYETIATNIINGELFINEVKYIVIDNKVTINNTEYEIINGKINLPYKNRIFGVDEFPSDGNVIINNSINTFAEQYYTGPGVIIPVELIISNIYEKDFVKQTIIEYPDENKQLTTSTFYNKIYFNEKENNIKIAFNFLAKYAGQYNIKFTFILGSNKTYIREIKFNVEDIDNVNINIYKIKSKNDNDLTLDDFYNTKCSKYLFKIQNTKNTNYYMQYLPYMDSSNINYANYNGIKLNRTIVIDIKNNRDILTNVDIQILRNSMKESFFEFVKYNYTDDLPNDISYLTYISKKFNIPFPTNTIIYTNEKYRNCIIRNDLAFYPQFHELEKIEGKSINDYTLSKYDAICCAVEINNGKDDVIDFKYGHMINESEWIFYNNLTNEEIKHPFSTRSPFIADTKNILSNGYYDVIFKYSLNDGYINEYKLQSAFRIKD